MRIEIEIPDTLSEGRRSSFKKGIADALIEASTTVTPLDHTPSGHEDQRNQGKEVGKRLSKIIQDAYPK